MLPLTMRALLVPILVVLQAYGAASAAPGPLVIVGGGGTPDGLHARMLALAGGQDRRVVVIPFASGATDAGESSVKAFTDAGAAHVILLATNTPDATARIHEAAAIWFPGGSQSRLMKTLEDLKLVQTIQAAHQKGTLIGGTSAGAAIMSETMIIAAPAKGETMPPIMRGLALWPEAIVDQHFSERKREPRLRAAVEKHPALAGVGIDEFTAVIVSGESVEVTGKGSVIVLRPNIGSGPTRQVHRAGDRFKVSRASTARDTDR